MIYVIVFFGALLGMFLTVLVQSAIIHQSDKYDAEFVEAFKFYTRKKRGSIYVGFLTVFIFMFVLPNLATFNQGAFENFLERIRLWSVFIGIVSQALGFLLVKRSHQELKDLGEKK